MLNKKPQTGRSMIENFSTKFVNFATDLVVKCKNLRKVCRVKLLGAEQNSLHRVNALASDSQKQSFFNPSRRANNTQAGRSMIEMLGVLAIMAVITVLSIMAYTMAMKNVKVNQTKSEIATIAQQIHAIYPLNDYSNIVHIDLTPGGTGTFDSLFVNTGLMKSGNAMNKNNYVIRSGINSTTTGKVYSADKFSIVLPALTAAQCKLLSSQNWDGAINEECLKYNYSDGTTDYFIISFE